MIVGILKEIKTEENRVCMTPAGVEVMIHNGHSLLVEKTAGVGSGFEDDAYAQAVCECGARDAWRTAPVVFESCSVPMTWYEKGFDLDFILQQGLNLLFFVISNNPWLKIVERIPEIFPILQHSRPA